MPRRLPSTAAAPPAVDARGEPLDLAAVAEIVGRVGGADGDLIRLLQRLQERFGYLPEVVLAELARLTGLPLSRIYGVVTFYAQFSTEPSGRHKVLVCHGTACHVAGAQRITEALEQELDVEDGGTTADLEFTLDSVACMGACSRAPVMRVDDQTYGNLTPDETRKIIRGVLRSLGMEPRDLGAPRLKSTSPQAGDDG